MINHKYADLFKQDSINKQLNIIFDGGIITNDDLYAEQFELTESLCSESELRFGCCEASKFKIKVANIFQPLVGKELTVAEILAGHTEEPLAIGKYVVDSDKPTADRKYREIVAYDALYKIINAEVSDWYNSLLPNKDSVVTLKQFRDGLLDHFNIEQEDTELVNDGMTVERTITPSKLSGKDVITAICEINGCFGHIGRNGKFRYVTLPKYIQGLYPANDLYPKDSLYPRNPATNKIDKSEYISCQYEDYLTQNITKLQIRQEENDVGAVTGTGDGCYIVEDNFLVYGKGAQELSGIAENLFNVIADVYFRPFSAECRGNPCSEVGDAVRLITKYEIIESYILKRTLKGIQALRDDYDAEGEKEYSEKVNSVSESIKQLKGKTNNLVRTVEENSLEIKDVESNLSSRIQQTVESITSEVKRASEAEEVLSSTIKQTTEKVEIKVSKGDISSEISAESGEVAIRSNRLIIESDNFSLTKNGEVSASGTFTSTDDSGFECTLGGAGLKILKDGVEIGRIVTGTASGVRGLGLQGAELLTINDGNSVGYIYNPSGAITAYIQRHIFTGDTRFLGRIHPAGITWTNDTTVSPGYTTVGGVREQGTYIGGSLYVEGSFLCGGTKNRAVNTDHYGTILMNAVESTEAFFSDVGSGRITVDSCCIKLDDKFQETIDREQEYQVFITCTSMAQTSYVKKEKDCFIVYGEDDASFDWIIMAKQKGYGTIRMQEAVIDSGGKIPFSMCVLDGGDGVGE